MAKFKGFSTIDRYKKFSITDSDLIKRDLLNLLSIREGELPGRPEVGTRIWNFIFEAMTSDLSRQITKEIERLVTYDPRLQVNDVVVSTYENTVLLEVSIIVNPNVNPELLQIQFDESTSTVSIV